jgi:hypothetical protein
MKSSVRKKFQCKVSATESLVYYELKQHTPWFHNGCSLLLDQRKQAKLQRLQNPGKINGDNLITERRETNKSFRNEKEKI